ncbi:hypothetical protein [Methyloceanibacter superfactus]|uniref:hypothetical protein n=1 Tax=Methyloceanibacter superfactus TaxID=1774969 RepID=UPI003138953B
MADTRVLTVLVLCTIVILVTALYFAASIFAPLTFSLFILALVWPMHKRFRITCLEAWRCSSPCA